MVGSESVTGGFCDGWWWNRVVELKNSLILSVRLIMYRLVNVSCFIQCITVMLYYTAWAPSHRTAA